MGATVRGVTHARNTTTRIFTSGPVTVNVPVPTHSPGDVLVLITHLRSASSLTLNQSGWEPVPSTENSAGAMHYRVATANEPASYSATGTVSAFITGAIVGILYAVQDVDIQDPIRDSGHRSTSGSFMNAGNLAAESGDLALTSYHTIQTNTFATSSLWTRAVYESQTSPTHTYSAQHRGITSTTTVSTQVSKDSDGSYTAYRLSLIKKPDPPTGLTVTAITHTSFRATWNEPE
jgi:hypothetical protein